MFQLLEKTPFVNLKKAMPLFQIGLLALAWSVCQQSLAIMTYDINEEHTVSSW